MRCSSLQCPFVCADPLWIWRMYYDPMRYLLYRGSCTYYLLSSNWLCHRFGVSFTAPSKRLMTFDDQGWAILVICIFHISTVYESCYNCICNPALGPQSSGGLVHLFGGYVSSGCCAASCTPAECLCSSAANASDACCLGYWSEALGAATGSAGRREGGGNGTSVAETPLPLGTGVQSR